MLKRTFAALVGAVLIAIGLYGPSTASAATPPTEGQLQIVEVGTDAMGTDTVGNRNREFVTFTNKTQGDLDIHGVVVEDSWSRMNTKPHTCNKYVINGLPGQGSAAVLAVGESVTVFNGVRWGGNYKTGSEYRLYANSDVDCGTAGQFYNNNNDAAYVVRNNVVLSSQPWDWNGGYTVVKP